MWGCGGGNRRYLTWGGARDMAAVAAEADNDGLEE